MLKCLFLIIWSVLSVCEGRFEVAFTSTGSYLECYLTWSNFVCFFSSSQGYMYKIYMLTVTIFSNPTVKQQTRGRRWLPREGRKLFLHHGCSFWPLHSPDATCSESCRNIILFKKHSLVEFESRWFLYYSYVGIGNETQKHRNIFCESINC